MPYITFKDLGPDPPPEQVISYLRELYILEYVINMLETVKNKYPTTHQNYDIYQANIHMIKIEDEAIKLQMLLEEYAS